MVDVLKLVARSFTSIGLKYSNCFNIIIIIVSFISENFKINLVYFTKGERFASKVCFRSRLNDHWMLKRVKILTEACYHV